MTERLYYNDSYTRDFSSPIAAIEDNGKRVYLERTAFYPTSGGQPFDLGTLGGIAIQEIVDEEDGRIVHVLASPLATSASALEGSIDWARRWDHMQQHTGQHLLSAVLIELFNITTVSFHMSAASSTIDVSAASISQQQADKVEERCAEIIAEARPVSISYEDSTADLALRKASARTGTLRIVTIDNLDRSACGGTHVRSTAELGPILLRKVDKMRGNARIEFVCGLRALRAARRDYRSLADIGKLVSGPVE
jgi:alanyl-tRNA synthetase